MGAAAVMAAGVSTAPVATATAATALDSYAARAESWGVDVQFIAVTIQAEIPDIADEYFPHTSASVDSLPHAVADGEFFDPGGLVRVGPGLGNAVLLAPHGVPPVLPDYPYIARATSDANSKRDVDASTSQPFTPEPGVLPVLTVPGLPVGSTLTGFGAGTSHAHADTTPLADAIGALAGLDLGVVKVGSSTGESSARQHDGVATATTTTSMKDITVAGLLHIADASVTATIKTSGAGTASTTQQVAYSGVTVAGVAATLDQDGLHVGGQGVPTAVAQQAISQLNTALAAINATLVASQTTSTVKPDGSATAVVDGVQVVISDNANYRIQVSLGHAAVSGRAVVALPKLVPPSLPPVTLPPLPADAFPAAPLPPPTATAPPPTASSSRKPLAINPDNAVLVSTGGHRMLILPIVAVFAELCLVALCVAAYRWKRELRESPEDLLAL
jgi:hypothetical protein